MSAESTLAVLQRYLDSKHTDMSVMADDVVFTDMASGKEHRGPQGVQDMIDYTYHVAFDASAEVTNLFAEDGKGVLEAWFTGKHIGDFAGVPATNNSVRVPLCVVYDLENDKIKRGRVYMAVPVLMRQLGVAQAA